MAEKVNYKSNIMRSYGRLDKVIKSGSVTQAVDEGGTEFIDFGSGIGVNSLGYCDSDWSEAVAEQARTLQHVSNYYYTSVSEEFAEKLCAVIGYKNLFFGNSGAEANECAIKIARKYSFDKYGENRHTIITLKNSFHGRTIATLSATGQDNLHNYFFPFLPGFKYIEANNLGALREAINGDNSVCGVMFEYIQGEGGVNPLEKDFINEIFKLCEERDILTISDEVQTGAGRTGKFLAGEHYGKRADLCTMAKGLGGGLPLGVCLAGEKCSEVLTPGTHGSTFGGNPIVCRGGLTVLQKIGNEKFLDEVIKKGNYIRNQLSGVPEIVEITGMGLMLGIKFKAKNASEIMKACAENGLLVLTAKDKLRFLPPLNITIDTIDKGLGILKEILAEGNN